MIQIGKIIGLHGLNGEVSFQHEMNESVSFKDWDCFLVELNPKSYIPFFIETIRLVSSKEGICKLEEINSRDEAKLVLNKKIYASPNYEVKNLIEFSFGNYLNFVIFDNETEIGEIIDVLENGKQSFFVINLNDKEILIPAEKEFIIEVNENNKKLVMNLPEGLLDI